MFKDKTTDKHCKHIIIKRSASVSLRKDHYSQQLVNATQNVAPISHVRHTEYDIFKI